MYKKWTITDIQQVLKEIGDKMGISTEGIPIKISSRMTKTKEQYTHKRKTLKPVKFTFAKILLDGLYPEDVVKETIIHEYCHFYANTYYKTSCGHNYRFKAICRKAGISDETCFTYESEIISQMKDKESRYIVECTNCGNKYYQQRKSFFTEHPEHYTCGECSGKLKRIK